MNLHEMSELRSLRIKRECSSPELNRRKEARDRADHIKEQREIPASDYEYFERMARELEAENLEGVA